MIRSIILCFHRWSKTQLEFTHFILVNNILEMAVSLIIYTSQIFTFVLQSFQNKVYFISWTCNKLCHLFVAINLNIKNVLCSIISLSSSSLYQKCNRNAFIQQLKLWPEHFTHYAGVYTTSIYEHLEAVYSYARGIPYRESLYTVVFKYLQVSSIVIASFHTFGWEVGRFWSDLHLRGCYDPLGTSIGHLEQGELLNGLSVGVVEKHASPWAVNG